LEILAIFGSTERHQSQSREGCCTFPLHSGLIHTFLTCGVAYAEGFFEICVIEAKSLSIPNHRPKQRLVDAYYTLLINGKEALRSETSYSTTRPQWNEHLRVGISGKKNPTGDGVSLVAFKRTEITITVWDKNTPPEQDTSLGWIKLNGDAVIDKATKKQKPGFFCIYTLEDWFPLENGTKKEQGSILLKVKFKEK